MLDFFGRDRVRKLLRVRLPIFRTAMSRSVIRCPSLTDRGSSSPALYARSLFQPQASFLELVAIILGEVSIACIFARELRRDSSKTLVGEGVSFPPQTLGHARLLPM